MTNSITQISEVGVQMPEWRIALHLSVGQCVEMLVNGCTRYLSTQYWLKLRQLAEERQQIMESSMFKAGAGGQNIIICLLGLLPEVLPFHFLPLGSFDFIFPRILPTVMCAINSKSDIGMLRMGQWKKCADFGWGNGRSVQFFKRGNDWLIIFVRVLFAVTFVFLKSRGGIFPLYFALTQTSRLIWRTNTADLTQPTRLIWHDWLDITYIIDLT